MGCTQSKIENEEAVNRCKDRKRFMTNAVSARNAFAAAHSAYAMSLKNAGAALSDYARGEIQFPDGPPSSSSSHTATASVPQPPYDTLPPPPPPLPNFTSLQRAVTMPEFSTAKTDLRPHEDPIVEAENEDEETENESHHGLKHRSSSRRSASGGRSAAPTLTSRESEKENFPNLPQPSPPQRSHHNAPPPPESSHSSMSWDYFVLAMENVPGPTLAEVDENRVEREEIQRKVMEEKNKRSDVDNGDGGGGRRSSKLEAEVVAESREEKKMPPPPPQVVKPAKKARQPASTSSDGKRSGKSGPSLNLVQIFGEIDDCFLKASQSAAEVSKMLEANRLHYHSNFADNRGHIDHSARVMRVITWNRSFRGLPNLDDGVDDFDSEDHETHATVLDKMLAWEKKLYDEVKAGELMKFDYRRKIASLNKLKERGASTESLEKTKASVSHLHTRYIVDMQSMDSTVSEINRLRDEQLYPKLIALVDGMAAMWENIGIQHESQSKIVEALWSVDISQSPKETSKHHHDLTVQLWGVVQGWHAQCVKLMLHQKEYIKALNNWLKLNLIPIDNNLREKVSSPQRPQSPPIQSLLQEWHDFLEKLPEELARTAIYNFGAVMSTIVQYQAEEMKMKDRCEDTRKELTRKMRQFEDWYNKYMQRRTPPDEMDLEREQDKELVTERQIMVETLKKRLVEEEVAYQRQCIQVREKSLTSLRTRLPEVFRALSDFSHECSRRYRNLGSE